jgi:hypothetical protein
VQGVGSKLVSMVVVVLDALDEPEVVDVDPLWG